jgi:hypothetical protein
LQRGVQVGMQDAEKQQRRHADVEHQRRRSVDEVIVDPIDALEQHPRNSMANTGAVMFRVSRKMASMPGITLGERR